MSRLLWTYKNESMATSSPARMHDGGIVFGTRGGLLVALDSKGMKRWSIQANGPIEAGPCVHPNHSIVFGCYDGVLRSVSPDGIVNWTLEFERPIMTTPCVDNQQRLWLGDDGGQLSCVSADGVLQRQVKLTDLLSSSPVCVGDVVYVSDESLMGSDGSSVLICDEPTVASGSIGADGALYLGSWDGSIRCFKEGKIHWTHHVGGQIYGACSIDPMGRVFVGTRRGDIVALSSNGERLWKRTVGDGVYGTPALSKDGHCFVASNDRYLYALEQDTGAVVWREKCGRELRSSPLLTPEGSVVVSCWDYTVYAFEGGGGGPYESGWPQFHGTPERRGLGPLT